MDKMFKYKFCILAAVFIFNCLSFGQNTQKITSGERTRLSALSMLETGNNDNTIGKKGEVSRYQILPKIWKKYTSGNPKNQDLATRIAKEIISSRLIQFEKIYHRPATNFEFYVLWNAPDQILNLNHLPSPVVAERAQRFTNLCAIF